jgi:outer membrane protein assembly factor BamB
VNRRLSLLAATLVVAVFCLGDGCGVRVAAVIVQAPLQVGVGDTALIAVCSDVNGSTPVMVRHILNWGDESVDTTREYFEAADTARFSHIWRRPGACTVTVVPDEYGRDARGKSMHVHPMEDRWRVTVVSTGHQPIIDTVGCPGYTAVDMATRFTLVAHDPDSDSIKATFIWGDGEDTTSAFVASPCTIKLTHVYTHVDTVWVKAFCTDVWGIKSYAESLRLAVGPAGAVIGWWRGDEEEPWSQARSPVVVGSGDQERIYIATDEGFIRVSFRQFHSHPDDSVYPGCFISHPSYSSAAGHVYVVSEEGQLYAFDTSLAPAWRYSDTSAYVEWGSAAAKGNRIYVLRGDSIFCLVDNGLSATLEATSGAAGSPVDAPVIDATGNVYFGTDSGYLYKLGPGLNLLWRIRLAANGKVSGLALRTDGALCCTSDSARVYAVQPDGAVAWSAPTNGQGTRPAVGRDDNVYLGTESGWLSKFDRTTGTVLWERRLGTSGFFTAPVIVANSYLYVQGENDLLYCLEQDDGDLVWVRDCPASLPRPGRRNMTITPGILGRVPRRRMLTNDFPPNPIIMSDGNIVVVGQDAVYLVKGYADGPLDPLAPWPKWQHDLYNSGNVNGGR